MSLTSLIAYLYSFFRFGDCSGGNGVLEAAVDSIQQRRFPNQLQYFLLMYFVEYSPLRCFSLDVGFNLEHLQHFRQLCKRDDLKTQLA